MAIPYRARAARSTSRLLRSERPRCVQCRPPNPRRECVPARPTPQQPPMRTKLRWLHAGHVGFGRTLTRLLLVTGEVSDSHPKLQHMAANARVHGLTEPPREGTPATIRRADQSGPSLAGLCWLSCWWLASCCFVQTRCRPSCGGGSWPFRLYRVCPRACARATSTCQRDSCDWFRAGQASSRRRLSWASILTRATRFVL